MTETQIRADERAKVNAEWRERMFKLLDERWKEFDACEGSAVKAITFDFKESMKSKIDKLLSGGSSNAPGVLPDGKGITGHKGESQLTGQNRGGELIKGKQTQTEAHYDIVKCAKQPHSNIVKSKPEDVGSRSEGAT